MDTKTENWKETVVTPSTLKSCLRFARESGIWGSGFTNEVLEAIVDYSDLTDLRLGAVAGIYMEHAEGDFDQNKEQIERLMTIVASVAIMEKTILSRSCDCKSKQASEIKYKDPSASDVIETRMRSDLKQVDPKEWGCMLACATEVRNESTTASTQLPTMYLGDQVPEGHIEISGSHVGPGCLIYTDCSNMIVQDTHAWIPWGNLTPEYQASKGIEGHQSTKMLSCQGCHATSRCACCRNDNCV